MNTLQKDINNILNDMAYEHPRYEVISDFFEMSAIAIRNAVCLDPLRAEYEKTALRGSHPHTYSDMRILHQDYRKAVIRGRQWL